jgi:hypothetical protein
MRPIRRHLRWTSAVLAAWFLTACYHYVPTATLAHPQGTPVRAHLGTLSAFEVAQFTVNNVNRVDGEVIRLDPGRGLFLSATWLETAMGGGFAGSGWTVEIPEADVTRLELKRFSWWRTSVVVAGLVAGTWLGFEAVGVGPFGSGSGGGGTVPQ